MATSRQQQSFRLNQVQPSNTIVETNTSFANWFRKKLRCDKMCCCNARSTEERHATSGPLQQMLKIVFISSIPCLLLFVSEGLDLTNRQKEQNEREEVRRRALLSLEMGNLVHFTQLERGTTVMYITSGKASTTIYDMQQSYTDTDNAIAALSKWTTHESEAQYATRDTYHEWIRQFRRHLYDDSNINPGDVINFYTKGNAILINTVTKGFKFQLTMSLWRELVAYDLLTRSKEMAGIERALGSMFFSRDNYRDPFQYLEAYTMGKSYLDQSMIYSSYVKTLIDASFYGSSTEASVNSMRQSILKNETLTSTSSDIWFHRMTQYIEILKTVQDSVGTSIIKVTEEEISTLSHESVFHVLKILSAVVSLLLVVFFLYFIYRQTYQYFGRLLLKSEEIEQERQKFEGFLHEMLPNAVASNIVANKPVLPQRFEQLSVMFSDIYDFCDLCSNCTPLEMVMLLNYIYVTFEQLLCKYDVYKVETRNSTHMIVSGLPEHNHKRHVFEIAELSMDLMDTIDDIDIPIRSLRDQTLRLRVGINSGSVVAGIVGNLMPRYCLFGDTVGGASDMVNTAMPQTIQMTDRSYRLLRSDGTYRFKRRGLVNVKDKGDKPAYILLGRDSSPKRTQINTITTQSMLTGYSAPLSTNTNLLPTSNQYIALFQSNTNTNTKTNIDFRLPFL